MGKDLEQVKKFVEDIKARCTVVHDKCNTRATQQDIVNFMVALINIEPAAKEALTILNAHIARLEGEI